MILDPDNQDVDKIRMQLLLNRICKFVALHQLGNKFVSIKILLILIILKEFIRMSLKIVNAYLISQPNSPRFRLRVIRWRRNFSDVWRRSS